MMDKVDAMLKTKCHYIFWLTGLVCCLFIGQAFAQDKSEVDMTSEACMDCHDDIPSFSHKTLHNPSFNVRCEDCHTGNEDHIDDPEPTNIVKGGAEGQKMCLSCHATVTDGSHFWNGKHAGVEIQCSDCHEAHSSAKPRQKLLAKAPNDL